MKQTKHFLQENFDSDFHTQKANRLTDHAREVDRELDDEETPSHELKAHVAGVHMAAHAAHARAHEAHLKEHENHMRAYFHEKFNPNKNYEHHESALEHHQENAAKSLEAAHDHANQAMYHKRMAGQ